MKSSVTKPKFPGYENTYFLVVHCEQQKEGRTFYLDIGDTALPVSVLSQPITGTRLVTDPPPCCCVLY